jgi:hypothetical protein
MMASGSISVKSAAKFKPAILRATRSQKGKMADFDRRERDEGSAHKKAEVPGDEINHPTNQRDRVGSKPSKGAQARGGTVPTKRQIDQAPMQGKKWIPGGGVSASNPKTGNTRMKGKIPAQGGQYGGGGRNTQ